MAELTKEEIIQLSDEIRRLIGQRIKTIREEKGITQTQLSHLMHSDRQYLNKIEHGKVGVSISKLAVIARALEVEIKVLVDF